MKQSLLSYLITSLRGMFTSTNTSAGKHTNKEANNCPPPFASTNNQQRRIASAKRRITNTSLQGWQNGITFLRLSLTRCALLVALILGSVNVWGAGTATLQLSSNAKFGTTSGSTLTQNNVTWTCTFTQGTPQNSYSTSYVGQQLGTKNSVFKGNVSATISDNVTSVAVVANTGGSGTLSVSVGGVAFTPASASVSKVSSGGGNTYTFTGSGSGEVVVSINKTGSPSAAFYLNSITVTYEASEPAVERTVTWSINETEIEETFTDGTKPTPTLGDPTPSECDVTKVFVGWTTNALAAETDIKPTPLYYTAELPAVAENQVTDDGTIRYYAVFATAISGGSTPTEATATLSFAGGSGSNQDPISFTDDSGVSAVFVTGTHTSKTKPLWDSDHVRLYGTSTTSSNKLTISAPDGATITQISFTTTATSYSMNNATGNATAVSNNTWTGSANSVEFTTTKQARIKSITVTYKTAGGGVTYSDYVTSCAPPCTVPGVEIDVNPIAIGYALDLNNYTFTSNNKNTPEFTCTSENSGTCKIENNQFTASAAGEYTIRVTQAADGTHCNVDETFTICVRLATPTNLAATNVTDKTATLTWDAVAGATDYKIILEDSHNKTEEYTVPATDNNKYEYLLTNLTPNTEYIWTLAATNGTECCNNTNVGEFITYITTIVSPSDAAGTITLTPNTPQPSGEVLIITATAKEGYTFTGWTCEGATVDEPSAAESMITIGDAPITLTANFKSNITYTLTYHINGVAGEPIGNLSAGENILGLLSEITPEAPANSELTTFLGWTTEETTGIATGAPTLIDTEAEISSDMHIYAVFGGVDETQKQDTYTQITTEEELTPNWEYLIVASGHALTNAGTGYAGQLTGTEVTITDGTISEPDASIVWYLTGSADAWNLYNAAANKYAVINAEGALELSAETIPYAVSATSSEFSFTANGKTLSYYEKYTYFNAYLNANGINVYKRDATPIYTTYGCTNTGVTVSDGTGEAESSIDLSARVNGYAEGMTFSCISTNASSCEIAGSTFTTSVAGIYRIHVHQDATAENCAVDKSFNLTITPVPTYTLETIVGIEGAGTITLDPAQDAYRAGNKVTATVEVNEGYTFTGWIYSGTAENCVVSDNNTAEITIEAQNTTLTANFSVNEYTVTWSVSGDEFTNQVAHNAVPTLPEGLTTDITCGGRTFVGWTTQANYKHAEEAPNDLRETAALEPITGPQTYYAVFAKGTTTDELQDKTASIDFSAQNYANATAIESVSIGENITATFAKGSGSNAPKYYTSGSAIRAYAGNTITITSTNKITAITLTFGTDDSENAITADAGTWESPTWTGESTSITLTVGGSSGNRRIAGIKVTYKVVASKTTYSDYVTDCCTPIDAPTASAESGKTTVTINWTTVTGASSYTIHLTGDGVDQTMKDLTGETYTFDNLTAETTYTWTIQAIGSKGYCDSPTTTPETIKTKSANGEKPTISFTTEGTITKTFGEEPFSNAASTNSTGNLTYSSDDTNVATVDGSTGEVTIVGVGTATITATVEADATYYADTHSYTLKVECATLGTPSVQATTTDESITLTWEAVANANSYDVTFDDNITTIETTSFEQAGLTAETSHSWSVVAKSESTNYCESVAATGTTSTNETPTYSVTWKYNNEEYKVGNPTTSVLKKDKVTQLPTAPSAPFGCLDKVFVGWTNEPIDRETETMSGLLFTNADGSPEIMGNTTFYAVFADEEIGGGDYKKITSESELTDGEYLIVYETGSVIFNGNLEKLDAASNTQSVTIESNTISAAAGNNYTFTIAAIEQGYSIQSKSGKYIGRTADSNGLNENSSDTYTNTISFENGDVNIIGSGKAHLRYNKTSGQTRFRYYKSSGYSSQEAIQLYKGLNRMFNFTTSCDASGDIEIHTGTTATVATEETIEHLTVHAGATLALTDGATLNVASITLRSEGDEVAQLIIPSGNELVSNATTLRFVKRIGSDRYYFFSLPFECNISDITVDGAPAVMNSNILIKYYDGAARANNGGTVSNWKLVEGTTLTPGVGYEVAVASETPVDIVFPMTMSHGDMHTHENTPKEFNYAANNTGKYASDGRQCGWNLMGTAHFSNHDASTWGEMYVTTYDGTYNPKKADLVGSLSPFSAFFIQADSDGSLAFSKTLPSGITARHAQAQDAKRTYVGVSLSNGTKADETTLVVGEQFTQAYEIGADLEKMLTLGTKPQIYTVEGKNQYAFKAINEQDASRTNMLGVYLPAEGEYTFALMEEYDNSEVKAVYLTDYETGMSIDLMQSPYTFTNAQEHTTTRFAISAMLAPQIATDLTNANTTSWTAWQDAPLHVRIVGIHAGDRVRVIDATGRLVCERVTAGISSEVNVPQAGVYCIETIGAAGLQVRKVVVR